MPLTYLASYPNSRTKSRPPTREEFQFQVYAPEDGVDLSGAILPGIGAEPARTVNVNNNIEVIGANADRTFLYVRNTHATLYLYLTTVDTNLITTKISVRPGEAYDFENTTQELYARSQAGGRITVEVNYGVG